MLFALFHVMGVYLTSLVKDKTEVRTKSFFALQIFLPNQQICFFASSYVTSGFFGVLKGGRKGGRSTLQCPFYFLEEKDF